MSSEQKLGGDWTIERLDMFSSYLDAYLTALKNNKFKKLYIDAFAGTGNITSRDGSQMIFGSAKIALSSQLQFDGYYFIEADPVKADVLQRMVDTEFASIKNKGTIYTGDANTELSKICNSIDWRYNRALLFLDPYATQVAWLTLEVVAKTEAYLFPLQALQRLLRKDGLMDSTWVECIDRLLGNNEWQSRFYMEDPQLNFFETTDMVKKINTDGLKEYVIQRLQQIFPAVALKPRIFRNTKQSPVFLSCFAVANKSKAAQQLALKIADHILKEKL